MSILNRFRLLSSSKRMDEPSRLCETLPDLSHTRLPLVKTYGRVASPLIAWPTTVSECPSPYTAAVSIQLIPRSSPARIAAIDSASSCGPHANSHIPPPIAQAPSPIGVICMSLFPSLRNITVSLLN